MKGNQIEKDYLLLKTELAREIRGLFATLTVLTTGSPPERSEDLENFPAEKLVLLKQKLKQKLDGALTVAPSADVRFKTQGKS